jgi:hypothetical protein
VGGGGGVDQNWAECLPLVEIFRLIGLMSYAVSCVIYARLLFIHDYVSSQ